MTEIDIVDWFGRWGHLFSLKAAVLFHLCQSKYLQFSLQVRLSSSV